MPTTVDDSRKLKLDLDFISKCIASTASQPYCIGGIVIDTKCRVLRPDDSPIPGLYAAGEVTGGIHGLNRIGGNAGTEVLVFGRIAGTEAARFAIAP